MKLNAGLLSFAFAALLGSTNLNAATIASSRFNSNDDGWRNGEFYYSLTASPTAVNYLSSGGNPGGHIQVGDNYPWNAFYAPAAYLGNQSAAYLGTLTFDIYDSHPGDVSYYAAVMISDGTRLLYSPLIAPSTVQGPPFHALAVTFQASTGWTDSAEAGGNPVSEATLQSVLANLQVLAIQADWHTGDDDVHLDNVVLSSVPVIPEPETYAMLLAGLGLLGFAARRRKQ